MSRALDGLEQLVIVGELEQLVIDAEHAAGHTAATAARPLHPWEQATSFALIDDILRTAYEGMARWVTLVRDATITSLIAVLSGATSPAEVQAALLAWAQSQPFPVRDAVARAVRGIAGDLAGLYRSASEVLAADAARQGVPATSGAVVELPDPARFEPLATTPGLWVPSRMIQYLTVTGGPAPGTAGEVLDSAKAMPLDGGLDLTRQAAHIVNGQGRADTAQNLPTPIGAYASELLDSHGCVACGAIDGTSYPSLSAALADYPGMGPYKNCSGGARCRGTVVIIWNTEAPAST